MIDPIKEPYYMIDFSASACRFEIRVNDIPIIDMDIPGQASTQIPINYTIVDSGIQEVSGYIYPINGEDKVSPNAALSIDILLFDVQNGFDFKKMVLQVGEITVHKNAVKTPISIIFKDKFEAEVPYKLPSWKTGKDLTKIKDTNIKLRDAYSEIAWLINQQYYDAFTKAISIREQRMATSMYLGQTEANARITDLISDFKLGFKVKPIPEDAILHLYGDNKIAMLKKINGESALYSVNEDTGEELMLDISFYIPSDYEHFKVY